MRGALLGLWGALAIGCGRVLFDPRPADGGDLEDAADAADASDAAPPDAPLCTGPFGPAQRLAALSSAGDEFGGSLTADKLELFFSSTRGGGAGASDLYVATRADTTAPFGPPTRIAELSGPFIDDNPFVEPDGLAIWFDAADGVGANLFRATRPQRGATWSAPIAVTELNHVTARDEAPALSLDLLTIYFTSNRPGTVGDRDLWRAIRPSTNAPFGAPVNLTALNAPNFDCCPHLSADGTKLMFTTDRFGGGAHIGIADILLGGTFGPVTPFALVNSTSQDADVFGSADDTMIGVSSSRPGADGFDLFILERACP